MSALVVLAKAPRPGRVKTRLCPPFDDQGAAMLAAAALADTLEVVAATPCDRRVLAFDGPADGWLRPAFELVAQRDGGLGDRLAGAFAAVGGPALVIGMDTPQLRPARLTRALATLACRGTDAVLGPALDGGYWAIGLRRPDPQVFAGVPMSTTVTGVCQIARLEQLGLRVALLPELRDVDDHHDAAAVARLVPTGRFAVTYRQLSASIAVAR